MIYTWTYSSIAALLQWNGEEMSRNVSYIIGVLLGAIIGGAIGYFGRCAGST